MMEENSDIINCFGMVSLKHLANEILNINTKNNCNKILVSLTIINLRLNSKGETNSSLKW